MDERLGEILFEEWDDEWRKAPRLIFAELKSRAMTFLRRIDRHKIRVSEHPSGRLIRSVQFNGPPVELNNVG